MHEFSIVSDLLARIEQVAAENGGRSVSRVVVGVGRLAGISPSTLEQAFHHLKLHTVAESAELVTEIEEILLRCEDCRAERRLSDTSVCCPRCGSAVLRDQGHSHRHGLLSLDVLACPHCGEALEGWIGPCPQCNSRNISVPEGRGILLNRVEMER
jgi:hydrogenase nickel incorporation protein HypA/HybF